MVTTNSSPGRKRPVDIVCAFQKQIKSDKATSQAKINSSGSLTESLETMRAYKLCSLKLGEKTFRFYRDLDNYELFDMSKTAELILINVDGYSRKNADLGKIIKDASKLLIDLKTKLHDANNAACAMHNCLKSIIGFADDSVPEALGAVLKSSKCMSEDSKNAAEAVVDIAGIQTFSNVDNLKPYAQKLGASVKTLKTDNDEYIKKAGEDNKTAQTELTKIIEDLNKIQFENIDATCSLNGQERTLDFLCGGECKPIEIVEEICKKISCEIEGEIVASTVSVSWKSEDRD